jgi:hypothetical protein
VLPRLRPLLLSVPLTALAVLLAAPGAHAAGSGRLAVGKATSMAQAAVATSDRGQGADDAGVSDCTRTGARAVRCAAYAELSDDTSATSCTAVVTIVQTAATTSRARGRNHRVHVVRHVGRARATLSAWTCATQALSDDDPGAEDDTGDDGADSPVDDPGFDDAG